MSKIIKAQLIPEISKAMKGIKIPNSAKVSKEKGGGKIGKSWK